MIQLLLCVFFSAAVTFASSAFETDTALPIVSVQAVFSTGSVQDPASLAGLTHTTAKLMLRGTRSHSKEALDLKLDQIGAEIDVETRAEAVIFRGAVLSSELDTFLSLFTEILAQPLFSEGEFQKLKSEETSHLLEEQGSDAALAQKHFNSFVFQGHPFGLPPNGSLQSISKMTLAHVRSQYGKAFRGSEFFFVGSGDSRPGRIQQWADNVRSKLPAGTELAAVQPPNKSKTRRLLIVDKPDRTQTQIFLGQIGARMTDPEYPALHIGNSILGGKHFSARLMSEIRVKRGWSYGASSQFRMGTQPRLWQAHLFPAAKDAPQALALTLRLIEDIQSKGVTAAEFEFSKENLIRSSGFLYNTPSKRAENKILEKTINLPEGFIQHTADHLHDVDREQVNQALRAFLSPAQLSITVLGTAAELKPLLSKAAHVSEAAVRVKKYTEEP